ncbi:MAG: hypothetical protein JNL04_08420 [Rhodospirillaceae bacterium]|nr:hypothetical protein [Rhodospirillaceae bacterium]
MDRPSFVIGSTSAPTAERASDGWHEVYDAKADKWEARKALPGARDHVGCVADYGRIHIVGGPFNTFEYNTELHHVYIATRTARCVSGGCIQSAAHETFTLS